MVNSKYNDAILIDFDLTKLKTDECSELTGDIGNIIFTAPEQNSSNNYNEKTDIYSLGMIIHFILTEIPYDEKVLSYEYLLYLQKLNINILNTNKFPKCDEKYKFLQSIYQNCFEISPNLRPNINDLMNGFIINIDLFNQKVEIKSILRQIIELRYQIFVPILNKYLLSESSSTKYENESYINIFELFYFFGIVHYSNAYDKQEKLNIC